MEHAPHQWATKRLRSLYNNNIRHFVSERMVAIRLALPRIHRSHGKLDFAFFWVHTDNSKFGYLAW